MKLFTNLLLLIAAQLIILSVSAQTLGSLSFNGVDNFVEIPDSPLNEVGTGDFTFEAWIQGLDAEQSAHPILFSNRGSGNGILFFLHDQWGGSVHKLLSVQIDGFNYKFVNNGDFNGSLLDGECHHVAITREGNTLTFYADGNFIGTTTPPSLGTVNNDRPLWIGKDPVTNNTFEGNISQCRIWKVALTQNDIIANKDLSINGTEDGLLAYWEMNNEDGQTVTDKTGQFDGMLGDSDESEAQDPDWSPEGCVERVTSTDNLALPLDFRIFPNPTADFLQIEGSVLGSVQATLTDQAGRLLLTTIVTTPQATIDLRRFPAGVYLLRLEQEGLRQTEKVVKM